MNYDNVPATQWQQWSAENGAVTLSVLRQLRPCPDPASSLPVMTLV